MKKHSFLIGFIVGLLSTGAMVGIAIGIIFYIWATTPVKTSEPALASDHSGQVVDEEFAQKAAEIDEYIDGVYYFEDRIDNDKMRESMYAAMMSALDDPYTIYYTLDEWKAENEDSSGTYYGIGSYVSIDEETQYPILTGIFSGSPAQAAGLMDGDIIYEVDGENVGNLSLNEVVKLIKGPEGTDVKLTIIRNRKETIEIVVTRGKVNTISVEYEIKRDNIGYIQIKEFSEIAETQFKEALTAVKDAGVDGIIIDLRGNGGGNLSTVLNICEELLPKGLITYLEDKYGNRQEYKASGKHEIQIPMVVLVNGYSASASELMTGALRDHKKATIIGTTTFGKGIAQSLYELSDGTAIKLTTASYFTPNGECVHGKGITPDIVLEFDSEAYYDETNPVDNQLEYALDYLKK